MIQTALCVIKKFVDYPTSAKAQEKIVELREQEKVPDVLIMLEHKPVITLGLRSRPEDVLTTEKELAQKSIGLFKTVRGGSVTYHGPGQVVIYPILKLGGSEADSHSYIFNLEEVAIRTCADFGIKAYRKDGKRGAWTDAGKIAAIGVRFKKWITFHGMSFNVEPDMQHFNYIVPCGLIGEKVTSLKQLLGSKSPSITIVKKSLAKNFSHVFRRELRPPFAFPDVIKIIVEQGWELEEE